MAFDYPLKSKKPRRKDWKKNMTKFLEKFLWGTIGWSGKKIASKFGWKKHMRENLADMTSPDGMRPPTIGPSVEKK